MFNNDAALFNAIEKDLPFIVKDTAEAVQKIIKSNVLSKSWISLLFIKP